MRTTKQLYKEPASTFYENHKGKEVRFIVGGWEQRVDFNRSIGICSGALNGLVVVETNNYGAELISNGIFNSFDKNKLRFYANQLDVYKEPPIAYPHRCKKCKLPARKCNSYTICSNVKCKSWSKVKKEIVLPYKKEIRTYINKDGFLSCRVCNTNIWRMRKHSVHICDELYYHYMLCINSHEGVYEFKVGDKARWHDSSKIYTWRAEDWFLPVD